MYMSDHPDWQHFRRTRRIARFATFGVLWSLLASLAILETAEFFFGAPHIQGIAYAISGTFAVWSGFAIREALRTPRPHNPRNDFGDRRPPRPKPSPPSRPLPDFGLPVRSRKRERELVDAE